MKHFTCFSARSIPLAFALLMFVSSFAFAAINPVPGIDIIVKKKPGNMVMHATTDSTGKFTTVYGRPLDPGTYTITFSKVPTGDSLWSRPTSLLMPRPPNYIIISVNGKPWDSAKPFEISNGTVVEGKLGVKGNFIGGTITRATKRK